MLTRLNGYLISLSSNSYSSFPQGWEGKKVQSIIGKEGRERGSESWPPPTYASAHDFPTSFLGPRSGI